MDSILVSIIVPMYNSEQTISRCIESVLAQSYEKLELILIDDGSTDRTEDVCRLYADRDPRISILSQKNSGPSAARNKGLVSMEGDYLLFLDADDYVSTQLIEVCINSLDDCLYDLIIFNFYLEQISDDGTLVKRSKKNIGPRFYNKSEFRPELLLDLIEGENINAPWCKFIKTSIIRENQLAMPEDLCLQEDLFFNIGVLKHIETLCVIDEPLYHYRVGVKTSLTNKYMSNKYEMLNKVHDELLDYFVAESPDLDAINRIKYIFIKNVYASLINLFHDACDLSKKDKLIFISSVIESDKFKQIVPQAYKPGTKYKILRIILMSKSPAILYVVSGFMSILKLKLKFKYL